jgi:hypothetical protein
MKTKSFKAYMILVGLVLLGSGTLNANVIDNFKHFMGTEFSGTEALYLMGGIVVGSLVLYLMVNHFSKEDEQKQERGSINPAYQRRHRHNRVVKKTS